MDSIAYSEQDGAKRQLLGNTGERYFL